MFKTVIAAALLAATLAACAGRPPNPVAIIQPQDAYADCTALMIEANANNQRMQELAGDQGAKVAQNVVVGVAGLFIPVLWFGMDFQGSAGIDIQALQARNQYLAARAAQQHCGESAQMARR